jgi:hypothetical protein
MPSGVLKLEGSSVSLEGNSFWVISFDWLCSFEHFFNNVDVYRAIVVKGGIDRVVIEGHVADLR